MISMGDREQTSSAFWRGRGTFLLSGLILGLLLGLPGCRGCGKADADAEKKEAEKKKREKPKPDFEQGRFLTQPVVRSSIAMACKPGHWTSCRWEKIKANHFDFVGEMDLSVTDRQMRPVPLLATPFELTVVRQAALPKGQTKNFTSVFYVPPDIRQSRLRGRITSRGGAPILENSKKLTPMPSYQYHFVVLARFPERYNYLSNLYAIRTIEVPDLEEQIKPFYLVSLIDGEKPPPLPAHVAEWSSIAYVLWDDARPAALESDLQNALVDWLHWGGQIVLSGPDSLDTLRGSFLEPYLPATSAGAREIGQDALAPLNQFGRTNAQPLAPVKPWSGVVLKKHPQATWVPKAGELLAERRVGRGRIVVSAFRLSERDFQKWKSGRDEIFNAFLLRRPPRHFQEDAELKTVALWADESELRDAARNTTLRYFTRDYGLQLKHYAPDLRLISLPGADALQRTFYDPEAEEEERKPPLGPGLAAWNDFSPAAAAAREALLRAARIEVPDKAFVIWVLATYLMVLVPLNYSIFKVLNRVEWAWAAAPVIALVCTGMVIKLAQLDIGFVRSRTEIAVLEIQGEYPRAHLTRYNALYTSLTTLYDFRFDDGGATALPFPSVKRPENFKLVAGQSRRALRYQHSDQVLLSGMLVNSNSTGLLHSEESIDLGGKLALVERPNGQWQIANHTKLRLHGVGILRRRASGNLQVAWIGTLRPEAIRSLVWRTPLSARLWKESRDKHPLTTTKISEDSDGALNIRQLVDLAQRTQDMRPGDVRLVAWTDMELSGLKIAPQAPQGRHATLVVAHLAYAAPPKPERDANAPRNPTPIPPEGTNVW